ncbi:hypothetical protein F0562_001615 [Nyssa sinensis]|uniref:Uncharacterized protein n=1 Tax=Nyssa sinensis TaxID=561372 RepID=A0A5J5C8J7_9ASTE|nr:hypothetical protein F0562_001615 [Nyssa sinensis]
MEGRLSSFDGLIREWKGWLILEGGGTAQWCHWGVRILEGGDAAEANRDGRNVLLLCDSGVVEGRREWSNGWPGLMEGRSILEGGGTAQWFCSVVDLAVLLGVLP